MENHWLFLFIYSQGHHTISKTKGGRQRKNSKRENEERKKENKNIFDESLQ